MVLFLVFSPLVAQTGITFTFANGQVTGTSPTYYEFEVIAQAGASGTHIGDNQVYINYNNAVFGQQIVTNGKVNITKGHPDARRTGSGRSTQQYCQYC